MQDNVYLHSVYIALNPVFRAGPFKLDLEEVSAYRS